MMTPQATSFLFRHSLVPATVTKSYHKLGRVKVRFPWMTDKQETDWVRVAAPAAGDKCGVFFMPEENDQVLVAFSHSHIERSYVLGVLWNNTSKPPDEDRARRQIKSRSGHTITLDDTKDKELISIVDKSEKNKIVLDAKNNTITIQCGGALTIKAKAKLSLESEDDDVTINGKNITLTAETKLAAEGKQLALDGKPVKVNGGALEVM